MCYDIMHGDYLEDYGKQCEVPAPLGGYRRGTIIDKFGGRYMVEFKDGGIEEFEEDQIIFD